MNEESLYRLVCELCGKDDMTKEEMLAKYGDVLLKFEHYYKFVFTFIGDAEDGAHIMVSVGGNADDIYKFSVTAESATNLRDEPEWVRIVKDKETIYQSD